jgi:hypothetical protein
MTEPRDIYEAADNARNAWLTQDENDQIGALNCAVDAAVAFLREENDRLKGERDEARSAALEEAAKLIEEGYPRPGITNAHGRCPHGLFGWEDCESCAVAAVRALKAAGEEP